MHQHVSLTSPNHIPIMSTWYQSKVKYGQTIDGKVKTVSELYLHEAVNFGEVELQCYEHLKTRIKGPNVDAIAKSTFGEVVFFKGTHDDRVLADPFFKVGIETGEKYSYLIPAKDAKEAMARALKAHGYGEPHNVFELKRTEVLAVWHPKNELWQGDWWNRMEMLKDAKKHSWDLNQESMFNDDGSAKMPDWSTEKTTTETPKVPPFTVPEPDEATRIASELARRKTTTPALRNMDVAGATEPTVVEAEDLGNGYEPEEVFHEAKFIPQLGPGTPGEIDDKDEEDLDTIGDPNESTATATRPKRKVNFFNKSDNKPGRRKPKPKA